VDGLSYVQLNAASTAAVSFTSYQSAAPRSSPVMDGAAKALGMDSSDLRTALQGGQSLSSIAQSKGMTIDTVISAMAASIQQANPGVSADQATKVATAMATRTPGGAPPQPTDGATGTSAVGGHHHHHHGHKAVSAAMDSVATLLGTTTTDLATATQSGQSLTQIASSKGVSQQSLVSAIATALQGSDSSLSSDQATQLATALATGTPQNSQTQPWSTPTAATPSTFSISA
jgi:uncharacterized protein YidB (DUF937 family)